jgi:type IV secretory pathway TraG/TraD family ATPase VirD4
LQNFERAVLFMCDEYSDVASEVPGEPAGDGYFFSLSRQFGCLGLVATQSVNMLQASSLKENWKAVFSNFAAKIFMRLGDNETAEEASKLAGETDWNVGSAGTSHQKDGTGSSTNTELRERKALPTTVLTQVIQRRQAAVVGSLDGGNKPKTYFVKVPDDDEDFPHA